MVVLLWTRGRHNMAAKKREEGRGEKDERGKKRGWKTIIVSPFSELGTQ